MDTYEIYCDWCKAHDRMPPSREWWEKACARPKTLTLERMTDKDAEEEIREGWGYGDPV